jgi:type VI secretion system secreted protein Hcp
VHDGVEYLVDQKSTDWDDNEVRSRPAPAERRGRALIRSTTRGGYSGDPLHRSRWQVPRRGEMAIFAKYDGIDGESRDPNHNNWVEVLSLEWAVSAPAGGVTGAGRRRGAPEIEPMVLTFEYEKGAPKLLEKSLKGMAIPELEIELTATFGGARATYLRYELTNVRITSYEFIASGDDEEGPPTVAVANDFEEIKVTYTELDHEGTNLGNVELDYEVEMAKSARKGKRKKK